MADDLRVVSLTAGGRPVVEFDMYSPDTGGIVSQRDSFKPRNGSAPQLVLAQGGWPRRPGRYVSRTDAPSQMAGTWFIKGDAVTSPARIEQALAAVDTGRTDRLFEWKPDANTYAVYIPILGPGTFDANYRWAEHSQSGLVPVAVTWPIDGVVHGLPWDVDESFDFTNPLSEFSKLVDTATVTAAYRAVTFTTNGESVLMHTGRNMGDQEDVEVTVEFTAPSSLTNRELRVRLSQEDSTNYIALVIDSTGTRVEKVVAGSPTTLVTQSKAVTVGQRYYACIRREGNRIYAWVGHAAPWYTVTGSPLWQPSAYIMSSTDIGQFPIGGQDGFSAKGTGTTPGFTVHRYQRMPYVYRAPSYLSRFRIATPGAADGPPCLADVYLENVGFITQDWAAITWAQRRTPVSRYPHDPDYIGDYLSGGTASLSNTGLDGQSGTSTISLDIDVANARRGNGRMVRIVTPATTNAGAGWRHPGVFSPGDVVTAEAWVATTNVFSTMMYYGPSLYWRLGSGGDTDQSGNGRNGTGGGGITIGGNASPWSGEPDTSTDFDGTDDRITSTYNPFTNGSDRSWVGWANRDTSTTIDTLMGSDTATAGAWVRLALSAGSQDVTFTVDGGTNTVTWTAAWPGNTQWVHWVLTFSESANLAELFINGTSAGTKTVAQAYNATPGNFQIGCRSGTSDPFDGKMDEVAIYPTIFGTQTYQQMRNDALLSQNTNVQWAVTPNSATGGTVTSSSIALSQNFQRLTISYTCQAYETDLDFVLRQTAATATAIRVNSFVFYEGPLQAIDTVEPGEGGVPPFGWVFMEDSFSFSGFSKSLRPAKLAHNTSASGGSPSFSILVDPRAIMPPELTDQMQVEVYAFVGTNVGMLNLRGTVQARPYMWFDDSSGPIAWQYGQPYGSTGHSVVLPSSGYADRITKLGTLSFNADANLNQKVEVKVTMTYDTGSTASLSLAVYGLLFLPTHSRALLPTGKVNDETYPHLFGDALMTMSRIVRSDLSGAWYDRTSRRTYEAGGMGGTPIYLPSGSTVDLAVFSSSGIPDDPTVGTNTIAYNTTGNDTHIGITPRYNLMAVER